LRIVLSDGDQYRDVLPAITDDHDLADQLARRLESALDRLRRDVLAAARLDEVLLAIGDAQVIVRVDVADVAGVEPAVLVDDLGRGLWHRDVTAHDVAAPLEDRAVLGDLHLDARERPSDRAELVLAGEVH